MPVDSTAAAIRPITNDAYTAVLGTQPYPLEETVAWDAYDELLPERELWKGTRWAWYSDPEQDAPRAVLTLRCFTLRTMHFLWCWSGPVWVGPEPAQDEEQRMVRELAAFVKREDASMSFIRLGLLHPNPEAVMPCQDLYFHDTTIMIDTTGDEAALRSRMKPRGRRDVNKGLRESPITVVDETDITREGFEELMGVIRETSERQGFSALRPEQYWTLFDVMRQQGMARLFVGREDGKAINWGLFLVNGTFAAYEVAATSERARRTHSADVLLFTGLLELQKSGVTLVDLVAIGSDYNPKLNPLNEFKTKWTKQVTRVGAPMEIILNPTRYRAMNWLAHKMGR